MTNIDTAVVDTIISQLGGYGPLRAMLNARDFDKTWTVVQFAFSGCRKYSKVRVELSANDLYDVTFCNRGARNLVTVNDVSADQLRYVFESTTGLRTTL